tara:strand:+ start:435 stop:584 length:150 start_codon:yes stop_codon:yes gene_type:complete
VTLEEVLELPELTTGMVYIETTSWVFFEDIKFEQVVFPGGISLLTRLSS